MKSPLQAPDLRVDYSLHPGFAEFRQNIHPERFAAELEIFRGLDRDVAVVNSDDRFRSEAELVVFARAAIAPRAGRLRELIESHLKPTDLYYPIAMGALADFERVLLEEVRYRNAGKRYRPRGKGERNRAIVTGLAEQGYFLQPLDEKKVDRLWRELAPWRKALEDRRDHLRPRTIGSCVVPLPQEGPTWRLFETMLKEAGIPAAVNDFCRYPMDLDYGALQLSHAGEDWWKGCYDDKGIADSKLAYLHYDQDYSLVKAIVYLQPVTDNGNFSFVPAPLSPRLSYTRDVFTKRLDCRTEKAYEKEPGVFDFPYVRKQFKLPKFREGFSKLPVVMQSSMGLGDDILDDSALGRWLLSKEVNMTSHISNCIVFNGGHVLHRGGMVTHGERWAIQVGFRQRDGSFQGWKRRLKAGIKKRLPTALRKSKRLPVTTA